MANREKALIAERRYRANNKEKCRLNNRCKRYRNDYGMTLKEVEAWSESINHCCEICGRQRLFSNIGRNEKLHVDHCHKTGKIRGLLCSQCNNALGCVNDQIDVLEKLIDYLQRN